MDIHLDIQSVIFVWSLCYILLTFFPSVFLILAARRPGFVSGCRIQATPRQLRKSQDTQSCNPNSYPSCWTIFCIFSVLPKQASLPQTGRINLSSGQAGIYTTAVSQILDFWMAAARWGESYPPKAIFQSHPSELASLRGRRKRPGSGFSKLFISRGWWIALLKWSLGGAYKSRCLRWCQDVDTQIGDRWFGLSWLQGIHRLLQTVCYKYIKTPENL